MGLHVVVQPVGTEEFDEHLVFHLLLGDIREVDARCVALVLDVEPELILLDVGSQVVDILHHEVPVALLRVVARVLERLDEERLRDIGDVAGKLTHLIGDSPVGVFVGDGQHLVGLQRLDGDVAQGFVERIFRRREEACTLELLVVGAADEAGNGVERGRSLVDIARCGIVVDERGIERVGLVAGHGLSGGSPLRVAGLCVLAQVGECHDVARICCRARLVGHPDFHAVDGDARGEVGERLHGVVVLVAEVACEEEVAVLLVVGSVNLEGCRLHAASAGDARRRSLLLRDDRLQLELAKLPVAADAEECRSTVYERRVAGEGDVARLYELDDLVFLAVVLQLHVLRVEVEGGVGVVVEVHVHLVAHLAVDTEVDLLVEVHLRRLTVADGE